MLKEQLLSVKTLLQTNVLDFVTQFQECLHHACSSARDSLSSSQGDLERLHDIRAVQGSLQPSDKVLVLMPICG